MEQAGPGESGSLEEASAYDTTSKESKSSVSHKQQHQQHQKTKQQQDETKKRSKVRRYD